jgi:hypothetical protein
MAFIYLTESRIILESIRNFTCPIFHHVDLKEPVIVRAAMVLFFLYRNGFDLRIYRAVRLADPETEDT